MYTLNVKNNYIWPITANENAVIPERGGSHTFERQGSMFLEVPGMGAVTFLDLGDRKLPGYPEVKETWGVLVRTHSTEAYYRYEGGGILNATFDIDGTVTIGTTSGTLINIFIDEMTVVSMGIPTNQN